MLNTYRPCVWGRRICTQYLHLSREIQGKCVFKHGNKMARLSVSAPGCPSIPPTFLSYCFVCSLFVLGRLMGIFDWAGLSLAHSEKTSPRRKIIVSNSRCVFVHFTQSLSIHALSVQAGSPFIHRFMLFSFSLTERDRYTQRNDHAHHFQVKDYQKNAYMLMKYTCICYHLYVWGL